MTYLGGSVAALAADRNTWNARANQAWGTSRVWNSGSSFETDLANMTASRDYWQHTVAHNDPNVWTNRYNEGHAAGYAAGAASKTTTSATSSSWTIPTNLSGTPTGPLISLTAPRSGLAHVSCIAILSNSGDDVTLHVYRNGGLQANGVNSGGGWNAHVGVQASFGVNAGDAIDIRATGQSGQQPHSGVLILTVGSV